MQHQQKRVKFILDKNAKLTFCNDARCGLLFQDYLYYVINDNMFALPNINYNLYNNS